MKTFKQLLVAAAGVAAILLGASLPAQGQVAKPDSVQSTAVGALPPSYCPNIQTQWYASGQVPAGYYKQANSPNHCLPIPACTGNQTFDQNTAACGCPAGTVWDGAYNSCHAPCAGGTAWNGSSCANICAAGTAWNGSSCASICAAGTSWNGSSCTSVCAAGTAWNGSSCSSICTGGQTWNGSSCACPAGQSVQGGVCGSAPSVSAFSITPTSVYVGASHTVSWSTSGAAATSLSLHCSGANPASFSLTPPEGGTGALAANIPGTTNCVAQASNAWGDGASVSSPTLSASCPPGTSWNGTSCAVAATPAASLNNKTIYVQGMNGSGAYVTYLRLVGGPDGISVYPGTSNTLKCKITPNGQKCASTSYLLFDVQYSAQNYGRVASDAENCAKDLPTASGTLTRSLSHCYYAPAMMSAPCYQYRPNGGSINNCPAASMDYSLTWDTNGTLRVYTYYAGGQSTDTYEVGPYAYGAGAMTTTQMLDASSVSEVKLVGKLFP